MAPDDLRDFPLPEARPPEDGVIFAIDPAEVAVPETARREPSLDAGPVMVGFGEDADDPAPTVPPGRAATVLRRGWALGMAGSLGVHLLPLLFVLYWNAPAARIAQPIPVTLVLEEPRPKPEPPPKPKPEAKPPPGRLASTDIGDPTVKPATPAAAPEPPIERPQKMHAVAKTAPHMAPRRPELVSALPMPAPMPEPDLKLSDPPPPASAAKPPVKHEAAARPAPRPGAERPWGRIPGPAASEDEYLAYANALIRRNQEMIPASLLKGRNGMAVIEILVLSDGTIARVAVKESSGYPEIDQRAERMVAAVKRFPPLPQWFGGTAMTLSYHMVFGNRMVLP